jgi:alpha-beta hydrolase superfamily lysophospholipase
MVSPRKQFVHSFGSVSKLDSESNPLLMCGTFERASVLNQSCFPSFSHVSHGGKACVLKDGRKLNTSLVADTFMKEGYAFYAFDLYGHGFSEGTRLLIPGTWKTNFDDYRHFCNLVASLHDDNIPLFLMGESYGCTLTIHVAKHFQENPSSGPKSFDSIILTAPAIIGDLPVRLDVLELLF